LPDKILVVDDEADIVALVRRILEKDGFQVVTAVDGDEALLKAEAEMPDLVLLDLVMPGKTGLEVCKILKSQAKTRHIPIVMFTALGRDVDRKLTMEAGADGHFTKPFTPETLVAEVKMDLDRERESKFSKQLGIQHEKLKGKKYLLEFDPSTPYERLIRDFVLEGKSHKETVIVLTKKGASIRSALSDENDVKLIENSQNVMLSPIIAEHRNQPLSIVYDNLTDLALSADFKTAYAFARNAIEQLSDTGITALILLNPAAHEQKDIYSLQGLFSNQITYGKEGITKSKIT